MAQEYFDYSSEVIILTCIAVLTSVYETRKVARLLFFFFQIQIQIQIHLVVLQ